MSPYYSHCDILSYLNNVSSRGLPVGAAAGLHWDSRLIRSVIDRWPPIKAAVVWLCAKRLLRRSFHSLIAKWCASFDIPYPRLLNGGPGEPPAHRCTYATRYGISPAWNTNELFQQHYQCVNTRGTFHGPGPGSPPCLRL